MSGDLPLREAELTAVDFETTGRAAGYPDEPWQIGWAVLRGGRVEAAGCGEFLLRVGDRPFHPSAPGRHRHVRGALREAPRLSDRWAELAPVLAGRPLVAHQASTERRALRDAFPLHRCGPWVDTLKLARVLWPEARSHALNDLLKGLGLTGRAAAICPGREPHDALYDAVGCALLLETMLTLPGWEGLTVRDAAAARPTAYYRRRASES